jgi:hypothetical protein
VECNRRRPHEKVSLANLKEAKIPREERETGEGEIKF